MPVNTVYTGYYRAHSAIIGNTFSVGNGGVGGVIFTTPSGGTTANYTQNGSQAIFHLDSGTNVIFAELILASGNFNNIPTDTFTFKTPTSTNVLTYGTLETDGFQMYHQDVTSLVSAGGAGTYEVSGVNCNNSCALWYMYVVYTKPSYPFKYIYYARGVKDVNTYNVPVNFTLNNVYTPASGPVTSYILLGSTGGDTVDFTSMTINGTLIGNPSSGTWNGLAPYNPSSNIQPGIICQADTNNSNIGLLDTSGTFGNANNNPYTNINPNPNRTWADITGMDVSYALLNNINSVVLSFNVAGNPAGFFLNTVAFEITALIPPIKLVDKPFADLGDKITYTVSLENAVTVPYTNVTIIDTIPTGTSLIPNSLVLNGTTIAGSPLPPNGINIGSIPVSGTSTLTFQVVVGNTVPSPNPITNQAMVSFGYGTSQQTFYTTVVNTTIIATVPPTKTTSKNFATIGDTITYTVGLVNPQPLPYTNVTIVDTIPSGTNLVPNSLTLNGISIPGSPLPPSGVNIGTIASSNASTVTFQVLVGNSIPSPNPISNQAMTTYSYNGSQRTLYTSIVNTTISSAILSSSKVTNPYSFVGDTLTYTIPIINSGNTSAININFTDTIPPGTTLVSGSFKQDSVSISGSPNPPGVTLPNPISGGSTSTITFKVVVITIPSPNPIQNAASTIFQYTIDNSINPNRVGNGLTNTNTMNTTISTPLFGITKSSSKNYAICEDILTYTISIPNTGNVTAYNVYLIDTVPSGSTYVSNSLKLNGNTVPGTPDNLFIGTIPSGSTSVVTYQVQVTC